MTEQHLLGVNLSCTVLALWCKDDVELKLSYGVRVWSLALVFLKVDNEIVLDGKDGVGGQPWVVLGVDLSDDSLVLLA